MGTPQLQSIQIGHCRSFGTTSQKPWESAIIKKTVAGPVEVGLEGIEGDQQFDRVNHGGPDKALLAYSADHFADWETEFSDSEQAPSIGGAFGENLTVESQVEGDVCVGDVWQFGGCRFQISQPRQPCWKLSRRWNLDTLSVRVQNTGRTGWYFRVVETGSLAAGVAIELVERPFPMWTITKANEVMYQNKDAAVDLELSRCPALSLSWQQQLSDRAKKRMAN